MRMSRMPRFILFILIITLQANLLSQNGCYIPVKILSQLPTPHLTLTKQTRSEPKELSIVYSGL